MPEMPTSAGSGEAEILDLTEAMEAPRPTAAFARSSRHRIWCSTKSRRRHRSFRVATCKTITEPPEAADTMPRRRPPSTVDIARRQFEHDTGDDRSLLSASTTAAVDSAFNSLAQTVLVQNSRTLDDLVREMLRPMLKAWLDDNLPNMVERMVRAEIERVSRGRG